MSPADQTDSAQPVWETRWHPLREEWVIVAAHRNNRPWSGQRVDAERSAAMPSYHPACYLCPGNARVSGKQNDAYKGVFVFDNDHPCVGPDAPMPLAPPAGLYRNHPAAGIARVVCYDPRHNVSLAELELPQVEALLRCWQEQYVELGARPEVEHVLIFENKGEVVGVSNPHPHCQIYATNFVFKTIAVEAEVSRRHWREYGRTLFEDISKVEEEDGRRMLAANGSAVGFVPYFARYAYESYVAPRRPVASIAALDATEIRDLAAALLNVLVRYDNLWKMSFPYVLVLHQAPTDGGNYDGFHFHMEFHPPLRQPGLLKYLAGPEIGGGSFLSDTSPEAKAAELRAASIVHYKKGES